MAELEKMLETLRPSASTKPKFAFKRKAGGTKAPQATPSESLTPVPLAQQPAAETPPSSYRTLSARAHAYLTRADLPPSAAGQSDLTIADLEHCVLDLCTYVANAVGAHDLAPTALHIRNLRDCVVLLPPVPGSALLHDLTRCVIVVACHQVRLLPGGHVVYFSDPCTSSACMRQTMSMSTLPYRQTPSLSTAPT
jgi:hypothetical protein